MYLSINPLKIQIDAVPEQINQMKGLVKVPEAAPTLKFFKITSLSKS